jgi:hypothetical protein
MILRHLLAILMLPFGDSEGDAVEERLTTD